MPFHPVFVALPLALLGLSLVLAQPDKTLTAKFQAGAAVVDITPQTLPVRVNGMFTERMADKVADPLTARALALSDGPVTVVLCVTDSCMVPREILDKAKVRASAATGVPAHRMLISSTHTHSAPSAMGCLGSRADEAYVAMLPGKIAEAMIAAVHNLQPARAGWTAVDDWDHTHNRRWIRRPDKIQTDPFGQPTVRANMHPGHQSPDVIGPSGPVDPQLSLLAVETAAGRPLAVLANYSMHYQGSPLLSSDYFGRFTGHLARLLDAGNGFTAIMSQGTSGDLWSGDYSQPAQPALSYDDFGREIAEKAAAAYRTIQWHNEVPLAMEESLLSLDNRTPDASRVQWAEEKNKALNGQLPQNQPDIYALEALELHRQPRSELKLQALRVGDLGITGIPNEVFCLTGLKLKARSPLTMTMNISLANGAEGYIPPPEQHVLGGYTTWPARTAKLEPAAETRITTTLTGMLEKVSGRPARRPRAEPAPYAKAVLEARPLAFWRLEEMESGPVQDETGQHPGKVEPGVVYFLPGHDEKPRSLPESRSYHFAGGRIQAGVPLGANYSVAFWLWNGMPTGVRPVSGYAWSRSPEGDPQAPGEHLGLGGTHDPAAAGKLILFNGNQTNRILTGKSTLALKAWHHVVLVREGDQVRVHLDGRPVPDLEGTLPLTIGPDMSRVFLGGRSDGFAPWEGKLDEIACFGQALSPTAVSQLYQSAGQTPPAATLIKPEFPPLSPEDGLKSIRVPAGYKVELAASEPQTMDPVAIDWDASGRLWVVEMADYPSGLDNQGKPGGRVRVLEDRNGDGRYEKATLFADGLNFPTGLLTWKDGVYVTAAPDLLFLKDTDGDGRADSVEKVLSGLTEGNQQLRANGLRWGLDQRIYCAAGGHHGGHGAETVLYSHPAGQEVKTGSRDFSFDPFTGDIRAESGPSQFGRNRDDAGHWFGTQNSKALWQYVLPDPYLKRNPHIPAPDPTQLIITPLNAPVFPVSPPEKRFHSFENTGHFTSACSGMIYRDDLLFPRRAGELDAFTCEPFHNLVQHNRLAAAGVSWTASRHPAEGPDFFASCDRWCRPVMARTGPDGALWVVDMYRYIIEHPDWLPENGRAELLPGYRLGEDKGRIYRVVPDNTPRRTAFNLETLTIPQLIAALDSPNGWLRDKAHMMLCWKLHGASRPEQVQAGAALSAAFGSTGQPLAKLPLLGLLDGLDMLEQKTLLAGLQDASPSVRENALRLTERHRSPEILHQLQIMVEDAHPAVQLQLAFSLGAWPAAPAESEVRAGKLLAALAARHPADPWLRAAVLSSAVPHCRDLCEAVAASGDGTLTAYTDELTALALALDDRDSLASLVRPMLRAPGGRYSTAQMLSFSRFQEILKRQAHPASAWPAGKSDPLAKLMDSAQALVSQARVVMVDPLADPAARAAAAAVRLQERQDDPDALKELGSWLEPRADQALQLAAVRLLAASGGRNVPGLLTRQLGSLGPASRAAVLETLLSREAWALDLLERMGTDPALVLDATQRARLAQHSSDKVRSLAAQKLSPESPRRQVLESFRPALALTGGPVRGREVFQNRCTACHNLDGTGPGLGPDLTSIASHPAEKILTNLIDPSLDVQPGYFAYEASLNDGTVLYGLVTSETGNSVTFKLTDGSTRLIARQELKQLRSTGQSLMPPGLETGLSHQEMADLLSWLRSGSPAPKP